jgi:hypothetical protein
LDDHHVKLAGATDQLILAPHHAIRARAKVSFALPAVGEDEPVHGAPEEGVSWTIVAHYRVSESSLSAMVAIWWIALVVLIRPGSTIWPIP